MPKLRGELLSVDHTDPPSTPSGRPPGPGAGRAPGASPRRKRAKRGPPKRPGPAPRGFVPAQKPFLLCLARKKATTRPLWPQAAREGAPRLRVAQAEARRGAGARRARCPLQEPQVGGQKGPKPLLQGAFRPRQARQELRGREEGAKAFSYRHLPLDLEAGRGQEKHQGREKDQGQEVGPEHPKPHPLKHYPPQDLNEVAGGDQIGKKLEKPGHALRGKGPGQKASAYLQGHSTPPPHRVKGRVWHTLLGGKR